MPAINCDEIALKKLCADVTPSVVSVNNYEDSGYHMDFTTGFIIYSVQKMTLIFVNCSVLRWKKNPIFVHFSDDAVERAEIFLRNTSSGYVILQTSGHPHRAVSFRREAPTRENVCTISELEGGYRGFNFMTGTICCPNCKAINEKGQIIGESQEVFLVNYAAGKWPHADNVEDKFVGAAIFDMVHGAVVGTIKSLDEVYDWKFCSQTTPQWVSELEKLLKAKDNTIKLQRVGARKRNNTHVVGTCQKQFGHDREIM